MSDYHIPSTNANIQNEQSTTFQADTPAPANALLDAAIEGIGAGISIIPIKPQGKEPALAWTPYRNKTADESTVRRWFSSGDKNLALVGGAVSGGLLILDFDDPAFYPKWREAVGALADGLPVQQTGKGGYHVLLRCSDPGTNNKLAYTRLACACSILAQ